MKYKHRKPVKGDIVVTITPTETFYMTKIESYSKRNGFKMTTIDGYFRINEFRLAYFYEKIFYYLGLYRKYK